MARNNKVEVRLIDEQREALEHLLRTSQHANAILKRMKILLLADGNGPHPATDDDIAHELDVSLMTIKNVRHQFVAEGLEATIRRKRPTGRQYRKLDGQQEAKLIAIACSEPPKGQARWTMKLLANKLVEMEVVESIDPATVCRTLKKTISSRGSNSSGSSRLKPMRRS